MSSPQNQGEKKVESVEGAEVSGTSDSLPAGSAEGWKQVAEAGRRRQTGLKGITGEKGRVREG